MSGETRWPKDADSYEIERRQSGVVDWTECFDPGYMDAVDLLLVATKHDERLYAREVAILRRGAAMSTQERAETEALAQLYAKAPLLYDTLLDMRGHVACDCGHPACKRCRDTREIDAALAAARGEPT